MFIIRDLQSQAQSRESGITNQNSTLLLQDVFKKKIWPKTYYKNCKHILENERNIIHIQNEERIALWFTIADKVVNKIDCYVKVGDKVEIGQKIGLLRWEVRLICLSQMQMRRISQILGHARKYLVANLLVEMIYSY
jgi:hypothetical protein